MFERRRLVSVNLRRVLISCRHVKVNCLVFFLRILFQDQFVRVMREKAELSDDVQRMEHVIMQLEGETETIGKCETESDGEGPRNQKCLR